MRREGAVVVSLVLMGSGVVLAQPSKEGKGVKPAASGSASAAASQAPPAPSNAISLLASEIARGLGAVPPGAIVVSAPVTSDMELAKGDELATRIATQVAGRLTAAKAHGQPQALSGARAAAGKGTALVHVVPEIARGALRLTADTYPVVSNGWERIRNPLPAPNGHAFSAIAIDPEIRSFMAPIVLEKATVHRAKHEEGDVVAAGCGDIDDDGGMEIVLVSRARVAVAHVRAGKLTVDRASPWTALAPRAPVPMREPLGGVVVSPQGHRGKVFVGTTDRGGVRLDAKLAVEARLTGIPIALGHKVACARANAETGAYEGAVVDCEVEGDSLYPAHVARWDAASFADAWDRGGQAAPPLSLFREPSGKLRMRRGAEIQVIEGVGAQILAADLDLDGSPELVTTSDGAEEQVAVYGWEGNAPRVRMKLPSAHAVQALAVCPPEERATPTLVVATATEVWLVR